MNTIFENRMVDTCALEINKLLLLLLLLLLL